MTIIATLRKQEAKNDAALQIASSLKRDYEFLLNSKQEIQDEIDSNLGEVTDEIMSRMMLIDAKIQVYEKVFEILTKC